MRKILLGSFLMVGVVCGLLLLIECCCRIFFPSNYLVPPWAFQYDSECGCCLKKNLRILRTIDYQQEIYTNHLGLAGFQESFDGYRKLIFTLGDSYTQGTGLAVDAAYPFQLNLMLNTGGGAYRKEYAVVNLGQDGTGPKQNLCLLKKHAPQFPAPQFILYVGCDNDYVDDAWYSERKDRIPFAGNPAVNGIVQWLVSHSETGFMFFKQGVVKRRMEIADSVKGRNRAALQEPLLNELKSSADALGSALIVTWSSTEPGAPYDWLKSWAERSKVLFADWRAGANAVAQEMPGIPFENPHSGGHHRTWVNYMIAQAFAEQIKIYENSLGHR